ncbi:tyrosine-type recombinase/integrase [Reyranella sp. CPCC 100927]|uniref:tyrosine-type recombinase/integrase n=1 Tax=Reyranella sp. CPCC 100927 TaxID=2599616 RepID=UPI0015B754C3|nr:tyrosine-type recombinase/integrase [Reyranella sp. CPCC 100927]
MATHLRLQRNVWFARFRVPADVQDAFEGKTEVYRTTGASDKALAKLRAAKIVADLKAKVMEARGRAGSIEAEALWWREQIRQDDVGVMHDALARHVADRYVRGGHQRFNRVGVLAPYDGNELAAIVDLGGPKAATFVAIATGKASPLAPFIAAHIAKRRDAVEEKTADMEKSDLEKLIDVLPTLDKLTRSGVADWVQGQIDAGLKPDAIKRKLSGFRRFWEFLQGRGEVSKDASSPFEKVKVPERAKDAARGSYLSFSPAEVARLYGAAKKDRQLADLIMLASYTGARIEELCALSASAVLQNTFRITDAKTEAGNREVPIHDNLKGLVKRLVKESKDGFLLSGLTVNKYGDRSNAVGKRFGYLKKAYGFGERHVFHSIRKCVVTQFDRADVLENVAADVVGHDKPRITYGLYSGGSSLAQRRAAVAALSYPGALGKVS